MSRFIVLFFFFSSRRRHTRYWRDWSSDVCSSDLGQLGIQVDMLDAKDLAFGDLSRFRAIVVGVRAYELRPELPGANQRLLDYVSNGGTLVVQYNRDFVWDKLQPAPYPALISPPLPPAQA